MRVLIFGATGMLGHKLVQELGKHAEIWATVRASFHDVAKYGWFERTRTIEGVNALDENSILRAVKLARPDVVINAIGIVKQIRSSKDVIATLSVNSIFPHRLSEISDDRGFRLITISTDCVFDGLKGNYSESDVSNATDLYGRSKSLGELDSGRSLTLRTSIIGRELGTSHSLLEWFLSNKGGTVKGFTEAIYSGFPTIVLADIIRRLIFDFPELRGLYNVSSDPINKYDLLGLFNEFYQSNIKIVPSDELKIDRSLNSTRFREITGYIPAPWREMVEKMAADPTPYEKLK